MTDSTKLMIDAAMLAQYSRVEYLCKYFGIHPIYEHILRPCFDTGQGYHNRHHCLTVARWCHDLMVIDSTWFDDYDYRLVMAAALFHDFGHDGVSADAVQLEVACTNAELFLSTSHCDFSAHDVNIILNLIRVTGYDSAVGFHREPTTLQEKIIRDADLMQVLEPNHIEVVLDGLRNEISRKIGRSITREEFCEGQADFMNNVKLFTPQAQFIYERARPAIMDSFRKATFG